MGYVGWLPSEIHNHSVAQDRHLVSYIVYQGHSITYSWGLKGFFPPSPPPFSRYIVWVTTSPLTLSNVRSLVRKSIYTFSVLGRFPRGRVLGPKMSSDAWTKSQRKDHKQYVLSFCESNPFRSVVRETDPFHCLANFGFPQQWLPFSITTWKSDPFIQNFIFPTLNHANNYLLDILGLGSSSDSGVSSGFTHKKLYSLIKNSRQDAQGVSPLKDSSTNTLLQETVTKLFC